jgi:serine/threonine protein kinase
MPQLIMKIKLNEPNYDIESFNNVSEEAIELLKLMLLKDPEARPSANECLKHSWLSTELDTDESTFIRRNRSLNKINKLSSLNLAVQKLNQRKTMKELG